MIVSKRQFQKTFAKRTFEECKIIDRQTDI